MTSTPRSRLQPRGAERNHDRRLLPDGGALQTVYLLVELRNDAVELRDALLVSKRRPLLDILMLSHEVGLLTLESREQERNGNELAYLSASDSKCYSLTTSTKNMPEGKHMPAH